MQFSPSICHINLSVIAKNFKTLGSPEQLMPVVKSDAYGHGLAETAQTLERAGAIRYAVGMAEEGVTLRQLGHKQEIILLMGCLGPADWELALNCSLTPLIGSFEELKNARDLLSRYPGRTLRMGVKVDTGMSRLGFNLDEAGAVTDFLCENPELKPILLASHLACADMPEQDEFTRSQLEVFDDFYKTISARIPGIWRSIGNSASIIAGSCHEIARPGIALYGYDPIGASQGELEWAMSVSTPVLKVREIPAGASISYGRDYIAKSPMRIAVIASGYATGFSRTLSGRTVASVNGQLCPQVGRICMGMACLDVTGVPELKRGDNAWIMGPENGITPLELAERLGTIPYEVLCLMGELNQRVYHR